MNEGMTYHEAKRAWQRQFLIAVMFRNGGNICQAALELDLHRNTLTAMLEGMGIDHADFKIKNAKTAAFRALLRERDGKDAGSKFLEYPVSSEVPAVRIHGERLGPLRSVHTTGNTSSRAPRTIQQTRQGVA